MATETVLCCAGLHCGYSRDAPVLRGIDVAFHRAEIVALIGGSGSGKSTLLRTLAGLLPPLAGKVEFFGEDLYTANPARRSALLRRTGMLFQHDALFSSMNIVDNVAFPLRYIANVPERRAREVARERLEGLGLSGLEDRLPSELSGGQQKRAALARALVREPDVLFCDEPTSGLDPETAVLVDGILASIRRDFGVTVIAVTHDVDSVRTIADRAVVLADGAIIAEAPVEELEKSSEERVFGFFHRLELGERAMQPIEEGTGGP